LLDLHEMKRGRRFRRQRADNGGSHNPVPGDVHQWQSCSIAGSQNNQGVQSS
jgi:hypothetical protein